MGMGLRSFPFSETQRGSLAGRVTEWLSVVLEGVAAEDIAG